MKLKKLKRMFFVKQKKYFFNDRVKFNRSLLICILLENIIISIFVVKNINYFHFSFFLFTGMYQLIYVRDRNGLCIEIESKYNFFFQRGLGNCITKIKKKSNPIKLNF